MLYPRIIPCLLIKKRGLVKTVRFGSPKYIGDPINAVRIFNEKEVDELMVIDIDATAERREPDYGTIEDIAGECRMPVCYGGGVVNAKQVERIISLGVEKVAMSSAALARPETVRETAAIVGSQSVAVVLDVRMVGAGLYEVLTHNGRTSTGMCPVKTAVVMQEHGAGEIIINSVDRDGTMQGYDLELVAHVRSAIGVPLTILGGAGSLQDIGRMVAQQRCIGAAAGSIFVFKGPLRAVLINYPSKKDKENLFKTTTANSV